MSLLLLLLLPPHPLDRRLISNLLLGGKAWAEAERMKIADLNWQVFVRKPL